jgi:16S rRNA (uracil1498-N3)-methyltransferase
VNERRRAAAHVFVDDLDIPVLSDADAHHLVRVLRLGAGETVTVSDGSGGWRVCAHRGGGALEPVAATLREGPRTPQLAVGFVVMKGDRPEGVVQKLTELGIDRIVPMYSSRSVVRWDASRVGKNIDRLRRVAREAAMQSRQVWLPVVDDVVEFSDAVGSAGAAVAEPGGERLDLSTSFVIVGPEGGWTDAELARAPRQVSLVGDGILRADTAAVTAGVLLVTLRGNLG